MQDLQTPSFSLSNKRALISGGSKGIGLACAIALAQAGAQVTILARDKTTLENATHILKKYDPNCVMFSLDVTDTQKVTDWINQAPPFDILVNSAGIARHSPFNEITLDNYEAVFDINLKAALFLSKAVTNKMIEHNLPGSIINISSQMGHVSAPKRSLYSASKFALEGLTKGMAIELGQYNIRVNTICPTFIKTEFTANMLSDKAFHEWVLSKIPLNRLGMLDDIMGPVVFLASDAAKMITGTSLLVDGGWTAE